MRGLLIAGGDTRSGAGILQIRDVLMAVSTCCDRRMFWDEGSRLRCGDCMEPVMLKPWGNPYPTNLELKLVWSGATAYRVHRFIEGWTAMQVGVDIEITVELGPAPPGTPVA